MLKTLQDNGYKFEDMSLSSELAKKIAVSFYTYKNDSALFSELLAYMSYEATEIEFWCHKSKGKKFLCIMGNDGGISEDNARVLKSNQLGKSSGQNISYFGAGARTAAKQYTDDCSGDVFGICDSKCEILYSTKGILGLSVLNSNDNIFKNTYDLKIKDGYTCWVLPWGKDRDWGPLFNHLTFMYNHRLTTDDENERLKFRFGRGKWYDSKISLFNSKDDFTGEKHLEILNEKYHTFECMNNFKARLLHTRKRRGGRYKRYPDMSHYNGRAVLITKNGNKEYYHAKRPSVRCSEEEYLYDYECLDWRSNAGKSFDEEFEFSFEMMTFAKKYSPEDNNFNPRRKKIADKFFDGEIAAVPGVRFLMKDKNKKVFIVKDSMVGHQWTKRSTGYADSGILNITLTKEQYKKYAEPSIRRTDNWNCDSRLQQLADHLYDWIVGKVRNNLRKRRDEKKRKEEENKEKAKKAKEKIWREEHEKHIETIILIQSIGRRNITPSFDELNKKHKEEVRQETERLRIEKERNLRSYNRNLNDWVKEQEELMGHLYVRHTKRMRDDGDEMFGNWIIMIGKSKTDKSIENRHDSYHRADHTPIEDLDEIWLPTEEPIHYYEDAETDWKKRLTRHGSKYKDRLRDEKSKTIKSDELFVCDVETIIHFRDKVIKCQKDKYESNKKMKEKALMRRYNLKPEDFDESDSETESESYDYDSGGDINNCRPDCH